MKLFQKRTRVSIKEAFDNLPTGLCYFNRSGIPILCNRTMHHVAYALMGRDLQLITELDAALAQPDPSTGAERRDDLYYLPDHSVWHFTIRNVTDPDGVPYTEYTVSDMTELCARKDELKRDNERLREMSRQLRRLSANVVTATREEEILSLKMRIHDQMGRSLIAARRILQNNEPTENVNAILSEWGAAARLLRKAGSEPEQTDTLAELKRISDGMIKIITVGELPRQPETAYLLTTAIRECVTNAVRYAHATELYAQLSQKDGYAQAVITNNGNPPTEEITEGGGLSSLRRHIERNGGTMEITSLPAFGLRVIVPTGEEESE